MSDYRILIDLLDRGSTTRDLSVTVTGVDRDNIHLLAPVTEMLRNSRFDYDLFVHLTSDRLDDVDQSISIATLNLVNLSPNNLLITLSTGLNAEILHAKIAKTRNKSYRYSLYLPLADFKRNAVVESQQQLEKSIRILDSRPDLVVLGDSQQLQFLDNVEHESLSQHFYKTAGDNNNPYVKKHQVLADFISEYYDRDLDATVQLLTHQIRPNNLFTIFNSFDIEQGQPRSSDLGILRELTELLNPDETAPVSTNLIETVYRLQGIPQFVTGPRLAKYDVYADFLLRDHAARATGEYLSRAIGLHASNRNLTVGGVAVGERIRPFTVIACHFRDGQDVVNNIIKRNHVESVVRLSRAAIVVFSTETTELRESMTEWLIELCQSRPGEVAFIRDEDNHGVDVAKWVKALRGNVLRKEMNRFDWLWLTNDSWFSCRNLSDFFDYYSGKTDLGLIGLTDNLEGYYHLQSYSWLINGRYVKEFLKWNEYAELNYQQAVSRNEIGFCNYLASRGVRMASYYETAKISSRNLFTEPTRLWQYVKMTAFPLVKLRFFAFPFNERMLAEYRQRGKESNATTQTTTASGQSRGETVRMYEWYLDHRPRGEIEGATIVFDVNYIKLLERTFNIPWIDELQGGMPRGHAAPLEPPAL